MHTRLIVLCRRRMFLCGPHAVLHKPRIVLPGSPAVTVLLALCATPAHADALPPSRPQINDAALTFLITTTPLARSLYRPDAYRCGEYAVFAGSTLSTVRYWTEHGASPRQAVEMTSRGGADAFVAERAAEAPDAITPDDFRRQALVDCLDAAAERK